MAITHFNAPDGTQYAYNTDTGQFFIDQDGDGKPDAGGFVYDTKTGTVTTDDNSDGTYGDPGDTTTPVCFCEGTEISTPAGAKAVETLKIGDEVLTASGAVTTVKWIGRQTRHPIFAAVHDQLPVCISKGALGDGLPVRDLYVSPDHAMLVQGCLVHASALINATTITRASRWLGNVEYYHVETPNHEIILAEGAASETFVDNDARQRFDNAAEFHALYPNAAPMTELDLPRISHARQLPAAIARMLQVAAAA